MEETYYAGVYWLARRETVEACAQRTRVLLSGLATCDPRLARWFKKAKTLKGALKYPVTPDTVLLEKTFRQQEQEEGRFSTDGFSLRLWSGQTHESASQLSLRCGDASIQVSNCCLFDPPDEGPVSEHLTHVSVLEQVLRAMAVAWEPEWGVVTLPQHRMRVSENGEAGTFVGWMMYFSRRRGPLPPLPPPVHVEPVDDLGTLVRLTPERFTVSNPAHMSLANEVAERLAHAGLLTPLTPWSDGGART